MLAVYLFTRQITMGFLVLLAGNLLCMLQGAFASYLPFGLSSLARISPAGISRRYIGGDSALHRRIFSRAVF